MITNQSAYNTRHRPSPHAMDCLRDIECYGKEGLPAQKVNFTVREKLQAFGYIQLKSRDGSAWFSTYKKGQKCDFMVITSKGREALRNEH